MVNSVLIAALVVAANVGQTIPQPVVKNQETVFQRWWNQEFIWKFDDLPTKGSVSKDCIPYSGYIYPDNSGGTGRVLRKYDRAFNHGRPSAASWEKWDTTAYKERAEGLLGVLGGRRTPDWYGHCNGWAAAAIRHAEPQRSVQLNGVVFTPADIKALLAEIYIYNDTELLAGIDHKLDAGTFHAILANWLGRGSHPVAMDSDPGKEKWNYPIYSFASAYGKHSSRRVEVNTNILYAKDTVDGEYQESPRLKRVLSFHYMLYLNVGGEIIGGYFYRDSSKIDLLWVPLQPKQGRYSGNERGNPYVNVNAVLAIWRASVAKDTRKLWVNIDPPRADRAVVLAEPRELLPLGIESVVLKKPQDEENSAPSADAEITAENAAESTAATTAEGDTEQPAPAAEEVGPVTIHVADGGKPVAEDSARINVALQPTSSQNAGAESGASEDDVSSDDLTD